MVGVIFIIVAFFVVLAGFAVHPIIGIGLVALCLYGATSGGSGGSTGQGRDYW